MTADEWRHMARTLQLGDVVTVVGRDVYAQHRCTVRAIQRLRYRAEITYPDGHSRWVRIADLRVATE